MKHIYCVMGRFLKICIRCPLLPTHDFPPLKIIHSVLVGEEESCKVQEVLPTMIPTSGSQLMEHHLVVSV